MQIYITKNIRFFRHLTLWIILKLHLLMIGLRTLCLATARISEEFYEDWKNTYYKASTSLQYRERKLEEAAELIERVLN